MANTPTRKELAEQLIRELLARGGCLSLSGPANSGKSSLLREMAGLAPLSPGFIPVYIDLNLMAGNTTQAFYEIILRELLARPELPQEKLQPLYQAVATGEPGHFSVARAFLAALQTVLEQVQGKLAFILDELDGPLATLPGQLFLQLRALADRYPAKLSFITGTFLPLPACGREEEEGITEFYELFENGSLVRLGGLGYEEQAGIVAEGLNRQDAKPLTTACLEELYRLAGGHPVLARLVARTLAGGNEDGLEASLRADFEVRRECRRIWDSLHPAEQPTLLQLLEGVKTLTPVPYLGSLVERGLVTGTPEQPRIFSRLFELYLLEKLEREPEPPASLKELAYDPYREELVFDGGTRRQPLSGNGALLFKYLFLRQSKPWCTKDELITAVWGGAAYSPENLDKLVSDLRQEIGDLEKKIIRTIPRRGLQMAGVVEWKGS